MSTVTAALSRRDQLLEAAARLFAERGFPAVGMDDIGAAAGISGPGVYRHFASKQALLEALCDQAMAQMLTGAQDLLRRDDAPQQALEALVDLHVHFAVQERALIGVWVREARSLSDEVRRSLRLRMRSYEQAWTQVVQALRDDLDTAEVATVVAVTLAMLNGTAFTSMAVPADLLTTMLRRMALAALLARE